MNQDPQAALSAELSNRIALALGQAIIAKTEAEVLADFRQAQVDELQRQTAERTEELEAIRASLPDPRPEPTPAAG